MDKYEYKVRADEIKDLINRGEYAQAAEIADTIDWRRVKSVMMLCTISDLYKINRRYEDARDMLLLAYERRPGGRTICYSLCELSIKMEEYVQAIEYYKEFVQVAPKDSGRYILQYKLYEAQDVSLEERIAVLEELKKRDYREKWAYELAYLYHRVGLETRCVEECDELILWFGDGKYVIKAMELKTLHQPLSTEQQVKYDSRFESAPVKEQNAPAKEQVYEPIEQAQEPVSVPQTEEMDIQVKTLDMGQYNTINLQAELAEGLREVLAQDKKGAQVADPITRSIMAPILESDDTESLDYPEIDEVDENDLELEAEEMESSEVFFGETTEIGDVQQETATAVVPDVTAEIVMEQLRQAITQDTKQEKEEALHVEPPKALAEALSQEADGQISLVLPEMENVEKQITGQMSIDDILNEWERIKKQNQEKREAQLREHVLQQTGALFTEFDASVRDGLLEHLEREKGVDAEVITAEVVAAEESEAAEVAEAADVAEAEAQPMEEIQDTNEVVEDRAQNEEVTFEQPKVRALTKEEKERFGPYIQSRSAREQLVKAIDGISMAAYTGNVIITGAEGMDTLTLAKNMIREVQNTDSNFSGKVAMISGMALNSKNIVETITKLQNGALVISKAAEMNQETANNLYKGLQQENLGVIVVIEDTKKAMDRFLAENEQLHSSFTARMDVEALSNSVLVLFGKQYAREREFAIDDLGVLALHTRIEEMQTIDHVVTVVEVKEIIDDAIRNVKRKTMGHFFDVLLGKRYDEEDMIILSEKDFV